MSRFFGQVVFWGVFCVKQHFQKGISWKGIEILSEDDRRGNSIN